MSLARSPFWRYCVVGGVGFVVDTDALLALVHGAGAAPVVAKILSFGLSIQVTFQLNRLWTFETTRHDSAWRAFATYLWVQSAGAVCNVAVFTVLTSVLPPPFDRQLLLCAAVSAGAGLLVNYIGASRLVFGPVKS